MAINRKLMLVNDPLLERDWQQINRKMNQIYKTKKNVNYGLMNNTSMYIYKR